MKIIRPLTITDAMLLSSNVPEDDYPLYGATTTYGLDERVMMVEPGTHLVYQSLQAGNIGHDPATSPTFWVKVGPTNRWRIFDTSITSQSENPDSIDISIKTVGTANGVALLNIDCTSATVRAFDVEFGLVYERVINPAATSGISDIYSYFREPITRVTDVALTDLPAYSNMVLEINMSNPGNIVRCGGVVVGQTRVLGSLQYGAKSGIANYSVKDRDRWGNFDVVEGPFSRKATWTLRLSAGEVDIVDSLLTKYRATPLVYIGAEQYKCLIVYGYYRDFSVDITYFSESICSLELEGLT